MILRLDGGGADQFRVGQGSHTVRTRSGGKVAEKILGGIRLMHFPVRSIDQLVAKSMIGSLTNGLRSARKAKTQATQWQRVADMERKGEMRDGAQFLFEEAMRYAQSPHGGNLNHNAEPSVHGINTLRRYSDGSRPSANTLYQAEVSRIGPDTSRKENWFEKALAWVKGNDDAEDLQALQYLFRKYGRSGVYLDLDFGRLSGFSTASRADCGVYVRLTDALPGPHFVKAQFDTSVAQALSGTDRLRKCLGVFVRDTVVPGKVD